MSQWKAQEVGKLVEPVATWNPLKADHDDEFDYIDLSAVDQDTKTITAPRKVLCGEAPSRARQIVAANDVLVSTVRPNLNGVARVTSELGQATASTGFCVLRPRSTLLSSNYLFHWVKSPQFVADMVKKATGQSYPAVSDKIISESLIPAPPLPEQIRIAAILDQADVLRIKRREALAQLDSLTQSIFIEMFGDPRENEKRWAKQPIETFISDMRGGAPLEPDDFIEYGFPILHKGAIKPQGQIHLDTKKKTFVAIEYATGKPRCIANREFVAVTLRDLVPSGPSIGLVADLRDGPFDEYVLAQGAYAFRIDPAKVTTDYFVHLSNMPTFRYVLLQNAVGSTQIHIRTPIYLAIKVPLPPIELQRKFSQRIRAVENTRRQFRTSLVELDNLFASLQHRAFRGELV